MPDPNLPHIPHFVFGDDTLILQYPVTRWIPGARSTGLVLKDADGTPGVVSRLKRYTLNMTLRFLESEWNAVSAFIAFGQTGRTFLWYHGEDNPDIPTSFEVTLGSPRIGTSVAPSRDGTSPWLLFLSITLESVDPWYILYFGISAIPVPNITVFVSQVTVTLADDNIQSIGTTTASAVLFDQDDNVIDPAGRNIVWESSDLSVATVDADGNVFATGAGVCQITATCEGVTGSDTLTVVATPALTATGGTMVEIDGYIYHKFDANGDFVITEGSAFVEVLLVAGGGGGGSSQDRTGGGGGAGGVKFLGAVALTPGTHPVVVGAGGLGGTISPNANATDGAASTFHGNSASGGGHGSGFSAGFYFPGNGGSGGGYKHGGSGDVGGTGIAGQGFKGGDFGFNSGSGSGVFTGSGGGGASEAGTQGTALSGGRGGNGVANSITGVAVIYGGGGGGSAANYGGQSIVGGVGGTGGGGAGATSQAVAANGTAGTAGLGGGGGAGSRAGGWGGNGGRGVVIIRYPLL